MYARPHHLNGKLQLLFRSMISKPELDTDRSNPFAPSLDPIRLLRPQATLWDAIRANGRSSIFYA